MFKILSFSYNFTLHLKKSTVYEIGGLYNYNLKTSYINIFLICIPIPAQHNNNRQNYTKN